MQIDKENTMGKIDKNAQEEDDLTKLNEQDVSEVKPDTPPVTSETPSPVEADLAPEKPMEIHRQNWFKRFWATKKGKVIVILLAIVVILGALLAIPATRYKILGSVIKKNSEIVVLDSTTKKPVSEAEVRIGELSARTDSDGKATVSDIPFGEYTLSINKSYFAHYETPLTLPLFGNPPTVNIDLTATGRQVPVVITDTISKKPVEKVKLTVGDTSATSDQDGSMTIVVPVDQQSLAGTLSLDGYNETPVNVTVTDQPGVNTFTITPAGAIYYLSKQTGKINVMKANLDGSNAVVVIEGTGNENDRETVLLASRDWQYMALYAKRKPNDKNAQLYLLDAKTGTLKLIDEGDATMSLAGWSDHNFIYKVTRNNKQYWEDKREALKNYNASNGSLATVDETFGSGVNNASAIYETLTSPYILGSEVVYAKAIGSVYANGNFAGRKANITVLTSTNNQKKVLKEFVGNQFVAIDAKLYRPQELYLRVAIDSGDATFYEYEGGSVKSATSTDDKFYNTFYPTFLYSPSGQKTFWYEPRNGKNAVFVGNQDANDSKELAQQSEYANYGWYTDKYVLLNKNGSELYVAPADEPLPEAPQKNCQLSQAGLKL